MKRFKTSSLLLIACLGLVEPSLAGIAVIVNVKNNTELTPLQIRNIYLGKLKSFQNGQKVFAYDIKPGDENRELFLKKVLRKDESNLNSYWARMLFSSKGKPPKELDSSAEVLKKVQQNPDAIGYIDDELVDSSVRVILRSP